MPQAHDRLQDPPAAPHGMPAARESEPAAAAPHRHDDDGLDDALDGLMARVQAGCRASFDALHALTHRRLLRTVLRVNAVRADADDVLQDVYVKVWNERRQFDASKGKPMQWLCAITRNSAVDSLRSAARRPRLLSTAAASDDEPDYADIDSSAPPPVELLARVQCADAVRRCLRCLPDDERQSLTMAFYDDLTHVEIARRLDRPLGTVKSWVRRAMADMRPALAQYR